MVHVALVSLESMHSRDMMCLLEWLLDFEMPNTCVRSRYFKKSLAIACIL
jgi:hypothetical protein